MLIRIVQLIVIIWGNKNTILPQEIGTINNVPLICTNLHNLPYGYIIHESKYFRTIVSTKEQIEKYLKNKQNKEKGTEMQYKTTTHIIMVDGNKDLITFNTEDDMNEEIYAILDKDKNAKIKIFTVTGKIEPKRKDLSKLIKPV